MKRLFVIFFCLQVFSGNLLGMELRKAHSTILQLIYPAAALSECAHDHSTDSHLDEVGGPCDKDTPFEHCADCCDHSVEVFPFTLPDTGIHIAVPDFSAAAPVKANAQFVSQGNTTIWQPPKISR